METQIVVKAREIYGNLTFYPANAQAQRLADLVGTKTLTIVALRQAKAMGFELRRIDAYSPQSTALVIA